MGISALKTEDFLTLSIEPCLDPALIEEYLLSRFGSERSFVEEVISGFSFLDRKILLQLFALQEKALFHLLFSLKEHPLWEELRFLEEFYLPVGGILGYQKEIYEVLKSSFTPVKGIYHPPGPSLTTQEIPLEDEYSLGVESLAYTAEIYVVGGAGDRLHLLDSVTKEPLPAAFLEFLGTTLLERLFEDLKAREQEYERKTGESIEVPLFLMTSPEKKNHERILAFLEEHNYFGRSKEKVFIAKQPCVPMCDEEGHWVLDDSGYPIMKPGGHGALWRLMEMTNAFSWLESLGVKWALIRQINNPAAAWDSNLQTLLGWGVKHKKSFGFLSCERFVGAQEGMDVILERNESVVLTNIEYTELLKWGIKEEIKDQDLRAEFPANTNILFCTLADVKKVLSKNPFPGLILNMKHLYENNGVQKKIGRLEASMQNVADLFEDPAQDFNVERDWHKLSSFVLYQQREKTILPIKKQGDFSGPDTVYRAFYFYLKMAREVFGHSLGMEMPVLERLEIFNPEKPAFYLYFSPLMGPTFKTIQEKVLGGKFLEKSVLDIRCPLKILQNFYLEGAFFVEAKKPDSTLLSIDNVTIRNAVSLADYRTPWHGVKPKPNAFSIRYEGRGEVILRDVEIEGPFTIVVPDSHRIIVEKSRKGDVKSYHEKMIY